MFDVCNCDQCRGVYNEDYVEPKLKTFNIDVGITLEALDEEDARRILYNILFLGTEAYEIEYIEEEQ